MIDAFSFWLLLIACIVGTYILTPVLKRFEAYRKGYDKGHAEGHEEGFYEGFQEGLTDGIRIGEGRLKKAQHIDIKGAIRMTTIGIEDTKDIDIGVSRYEVRIDFDGNGTTRIELSRSDAELLHERLGEALRKV